MSEYVDRDLSRWGFGESGSQEGRKLHTADLRVGDLILAKCGTTISGAQCWYVERPSRLDQEGTP